MSSSSFSNVIHAEIGNRWPEMLEGAYLVSFFKELEALDPLVFHNFRFLIANKNTRFGPLLPPFSGHDVVLIWLSDEEASIPPADFCRNFRLILKSYWPLGEGVRNILPFPLCGASEVVRTEPLPGLSAKPRFSLQEISTPIGWIFSVNLTAFATFRRGIFRFTGKRGYTGRPFCVLQFPCAGIFQTDSPIPLSPSRMPLRPE